MAIEIDPRKASHTAVVVDSTGEVNGAVTVEARGERWQTELEALRCLERHVARTIYRTLETASVETATAAAST